MANLYPPIVPSIQPAFVNFCYIYFKLPQYMSKEDIKDVQITFVDQKTNKTVLNALGIKRFSFKDFSQINDTRKDESKYPYNDYKYYIKMNVNNFSQVVEKNQYYKIQLRFTANDVHVQESESSGNPRIGSPDDPDTGNPSADWINENINYFSEWSTVTLVKRIHAPRLSVNLLAETPQLPQPISSLTNLVGKLNFIFDPNETEKEETEYLKSFHIAIYPCDKNGVINGAELSLYRSDEIYTNAYNHNEFNYQLNYDFENNKYYAIRFFCTTNNLYIWYTTLTFQKVGSNEAFLNANLQVTPEKNWGRNKIYFKLNNNNNNDLIIRRTSSKTKFLKWETIKNLSDNNSLEYLWYDTTIESGIWYKYRIQSNKGSIDSEPIMCPFEDIFLTNKNRQLKFQFNPSISDFKYNVNESQQITLGSQYPFIRRNGNNYYRSFSISGLISALTDQENWYNSNYDQEDGYFYNKNIMQPFTTANELYGDAATELYNNYNIENNINQYQDYIYEKEFRQKVMDFLYKNDIKLFRSLTEGNILIKLTNITLSPVETLGRMLYSFSASAVEIAEYNLDNLKNYNLINKFYYTYNIGEILNYSIENQKSLIDVIYNENNSLQKQDTDIMQLIFTYSGPENIIVYAKPENNNDIFKYVLQNGQLVLKYTDADPIAESYFYGIQLNKNNYIETNGYYDTINDIQNPQNLHIYHIGDPSSCLIDNYISFYESSGVLQTYQSEINFITETGEIALIAEINYYKIIYYNGNWYPLSKNLDILVDNLNINIKYLYRTKKEDII